MPSNVYRYKFARTVAMEDVESTVVLAIMAAESLHGEAQTRLDAAHFLDPAMRACVIDAGTPVGRDLNRLFIGFVSREFGPDSFDVERIESTPTKKPKEVAA